MGYCGHLELPILWQRTPTVMRERQAETIGNIKNSFDMKGAICVEANPDDLSEETLKQPLNMFRLPSATESHGG
jgi:hypothetical protein